MKLRFKSESLRMFRFSPNQGIKSYFAFRLSKSVYYLDESEQGVFEIHS